MKALHINGNDLTPEAVREVSVERRPVLLDPDAREAVNRARAIVDSVVAQNQLSYAITTGVGKLSDVRIAGDQIRELQVNLVRSHSVGVGEPLSIPETRAMMLLRANSLSKGYSGVRAATIDTLCEMLNRGVTPCHSVCSVARQRRGEWRSGAAGSSSAVDDRRRGMPG